MPMFWFDQVAELSPELASKAKVSSADILTDFSSLTNIIFF